MDKHILGLVLFYVREGDELNAGRKSLVRKGTGAAGNAAGHNRKRYTGRR